jgi:hypothetical protein
MRPKRGVDVKKGPFRPLFGLFSQTQETAGSRTLLEVYSSKGDQAGSEAKFAVGIACSLRPVRSIE